MANRKVPTRVCVGCKEMKPKKDLIRVIKTPDDRILLDESGKLNGRGAYICRSEECLKKALSSKGLERSLKASIPPEVTEDLQKEMKELAK